MTLNKYLKRKDRETFAELIGTTKNYVNLLACGSRIPSRKLALKIEKATKSEVTVLELLFPEGKS